jgi:hypothetical protein
MRKERRRVMFNYIRVSIVCWIPMMVFYLLEMSGVHSPLFNVISRGLLHLSNHHRIDILLESDEQ